MEVASPLSFAPSGTKRAFAYPVQLKESPGCAGSIVEDNCDPTQRATKRRRFHGDAAEAAAQFHSSPFSSNQTLLFSASKSIRSVAGCAFPGTTCFREMLCFCMVQTVPLVLRACFRLSFVLAFVLAFVILCLFLIVAVSRSVDQSLKRSRTTVAAEQLHLVVEEQAAVIESLKTEKKELQSSVDNLKAENERTQKENHILRRAVHIQQDRQNHAESELKNAVKYREGAEQQIRKMEQMILSLRYHLQARQPTADDFMGIPPPDVF